jgi:hypothetical protein
VSLPHLKVGMLCCVAIGVAPPYWSALGTLARVFVTRLSLVGWTIWCRQIFRSDLSRNWYVHYFQPLLSTGQAWELELSFETHNCSFGSLSASAQYQFQGGSMFCFHQNVTGLPHIHRGCISSVFCPTPTRWR